MFWTLTLALAADAGFTWPVHPCLRPHPAAAIVRVEVDGRTHPAAVISPDGYLLTSPDVGWFPTATVTLRSGRQLDATVVRQTHDAALVQVVSRRALACLSPSDGAAIDAPLTVTHRDGRRLVRTTVTRDGTTHDDGLGLTTPHPQLRTPSAPVLTPDRRFVGLLRPTRPSPADASTSSVVPWDVLLDDLHAAFDQPFPTERTRRELPASHFDADGEPDSTQGQRTVLTKAHLHRLPFGSSFPQRTPEAAKDEACVDATRAGDAPAVGRPVNVVTSPLDDGHYLIQPAFVPNWPATARDETVASGIGIEIRLADGAELRIPLRPMHLTIHPTYARPLLPGAEPWGALRRDHLRALAASPIEDVRLLLPDQTFTWPADEADPEPVRRAATAVHACFTRLDATLTSLGL